MPVVIMRLGRIFYSFSQRALHRPSLHHREDQLVALFIDSPCNFFIDRIEAVLSDFGNLHIAEDGERNHDLMLEPVFHHPTQRVSAA